MESLFPGIPPAVRHCPPPNSRDFVWEIVHQLKTPVERDGKTYRSVCLLCSEESTSKSCAAPDAWTKGLCNISSTSNAKKHIVSKHKHIAFPGKVTKTRARNQNQQLQAQLGKRVPMERGPTEIVRSKAKRPRLVQSKIPRAAMESVPASVLQAPQQQSLNGTFQDAAMGEHDTDISQHTAPWESAELEQSSIDPADSGDVRQLVERAVDEYKTHLKIESNWTNALWEQLSGSLELSYQMDKSCHALASWLNELSGDDERNANRKSIDLVMSVFTVLPKAHESAQHVIQQYGPSSDELDGLATEADAMIYRAKSATNNYQRSVLLQTAIESTVKVCSAWFERILGLEKAVAESRTKDQNAQESLQRILNCCVEHAALYHDKIKSGGSFVSKENPVKDSRSEKIHEIVDKRREELIKMSEPERFAEVQAFREVVNSTDYTVVESWRELDDCTEAVRLCQANMVIEKSASCFYESLADLLRCVSKKRVHVLEQIDKAQKVIKSEAVAALSESIEILMDTSLEFYQLHLDQQATASTAQESLKEELDKLIDHFGDQTPTDQDICERRLREYSGIFAASKEKTMKVAEAQRSLWEGKCRLLPHKIRVALIEEYEQLCQQLRGPIYEVMQQLVETMKSEHDSLTDNDTGTMMDMLHVAQDEIDLTGDDALESPTQFSVGAVVFAKIHQTKARSEFKSGKVAELLGDGTYTMSFDDGHTSTVSAADLFTKEQVEDEKSAPQDVNMLDMTNSADDESSDATFRCVVM